LEFDGQREGNWKGLILEVLQECQNFTDVILWKMKERHKIMDVIYNSVFSSSHHLLKGDGKLIGIERPTFPDLFAR